MKRSTYGREGGEHLDCFEVVGNRVGNQFLVELVTQHDLVLELRRQRPLISLCDIATGRTLRSQIHHNSTALIPARRQVKRAAGLECHVTSTVLRVFLGQLPLEVQARGEIASSAPPR